MDYESRERRVIVWDKPHKDFLKKHKQPVGVGLMARSRRVLARGNHGAD
jgi:hypothetical protein